MGALNTTVTKFIGGLTEVSATAKNVRFSVLGTWATGDTFKVVIANNVTGLLVSIGSGTVTGLVPSYAFTYKRKMNVLCGTSWAISGIDTPNKFNDQNLAGRGVIELADYFAAPSAGKAIVPFQGKAVIFGDQSSQIWAVASLMDEYNNDQVLDNTGSIAALSAQSWGELEVYFLDTTGVRSYRTKVNSLNAILTDIGSPVDIAIQAKLATCTATERAAACGVIDPTSGRYMLFIKDTIYVLSNFPAAGVQAWARYTPSYQAADVFTVQHDYASPLVIKFSMSSDMTKAFYVSAYTAGGVVLPALPAVYVSVGDPAVPSEVSSAIPGGLAFRGSIVYVSAGGYFTFTSNQTAFVPEKFITHKKQVIARSSNAMYAYGGVTGYEYDNAVATAKIPWLEIGKNVTSNGIDASMTDAWYVYASMDYLSEQFTEVLAAQSLATYDGGRIPFSSVGSHFSMQVVSNAASRALMSALTFNY